MALQQDMTIHGASDKNYIKQAYEYLKANVVTDYAGVKHDYTAATSI